MPAQSAEDLKVRAALTAAQMYYLQNLTMDAIARELKTSRSSVSRLLAHARDTGLVNIQINSPLERGGQLEQEIARRFKVTTHVVPIPETTSDVDRLERVGMTAARLLGRYVDSNMTVGVAWGSTLSAISRHLVRKDTHNTVIVQLNGAGNTQTTGIDYASEILQRFGATFSAQIQQFPVPAFFDDPQTKEALWRERSTKRVLEIQSRMDVAVFGLGSPRCRATSTSAATWMRRTTARSAPTRWWATSPPCSSGRTAAGRTSPSTPAAPACTSTGCAASRGASASSPARRRRACAGRSPRS